MTTANSPRRLFVPLSAEPFEWFSSGAKSWEVRRNKGAFRVDLLAEGRRVELRRGYTGKSLWGTLAEAVVASDVADLFGRISFKAAVPTATSALGAGAFVETLLGQDSELVAFRVELDPADADTTEIRFDPTFLESVDSGKKTTTVRAGHRSYNAGPLILRFGETARDAVLLQCRFTTLGALTENDAQTDGFQSVRELITALLRYYPDLIETSPITIVEFRCRQS